MDNVSWMTILNVLDCLWMENGYVILEGNRYMLKIFLNIRKNKIRITN